MNSLLLAYLTFAFILVITPGSTTAVVVRNTLIGGRSAGVAAALGAAFGNTAHAMAAGLGLAIVFARWPVAMVALRVTGALYLAWLGAVSLYRVMRHADGGMRMTATETDRWARHGSLRQGLGVNLLNPAIATFYLVVVPSFVPSNAPRGYFAMLASIHIVMAFMCHSMWALGLDKLREFFRPPVARRILEGVTAAALLALAARVLFQ